MSVEEFLGRLERVKRSGSDWMARCPAHEDKHASLSIAEGDDGRVLLHCFAGCAVEEIVRAVGCTLADLFQGEGEGSTPRSRGRVVQLVRVDGEPVDTSGGLTVEALAEGKRLPHELLREVGCETVHYFGAPAVQIPYTDEGGEIVGIRFRLSLTGEPKFRWKKGTKASTLLYGTGRLRKAREAGFVFLVEGETDAWTLMHHGFPVVALPGAAMWSDEQHAARLDGIETVYLVVEPDRGGAALLDALRASSIRPRVQVIHLSVKDLSELHLLDETSFGSRLNEAMESATPLLDVEAEARRERAALYWAKSEPLAREPDILDSFAQELRKRGFVGPLLTPKLVFLVLVSRRLRRPVSLVLRGLSSAGKSYTVESTLPFFPRSAYFSRSGMSERALIFSEESFEHRMLYIAEADAIASDGFGAYFFRTLISENRLVYEVTEKEADRLVTRVIEKQGPVGAILTTTRLRLHAENETRMLSLTVPDDPGLTRQIMRAIAVRDDEVADQEPPEEWKALQSWLELGGERRVVDEDGFLLVVADHIPVVAVRLRRDFELIRSLVYAHAILHQASRPRDKRGRIVATLTDYAAVHALIADIVAEGIGATVSDDVRETVAAVRAIVGDDAEATAKRAQVQTELDLDDRATRRRLAQTVEGGFIVNTNPGRGKTALYAIGDPIPDDVDVLPSVAALLSVMGHPDNPDNLATDPGDRTPPPPELAADLLDCLVCGGEYGLDEEHPERLRCPACVAGRRPVTPGPS